MANDRSRATKGKEKLLVSMFCFKAGLLKVQLQKRNIVNRVIPELMCTRSDSSYRSTKPLVDLQGIPGCSPAAEGLL